MGDLELITAAYEDGLRDGRQRLIESLQQEGWELKLYALFHEDKLVGVTEDLSESDYRENIEEGLVVAVKTIKLEWEQNKWIRRGEWYPYPRQWRSKNCYNHPLTDERGYARRLVEKRGADKVLVTRRCLFCDATEDYVIPSKYVKHLSSYKNL